MTLTVDDLKAHLNIVGDLDEADAVTVPRVLAAATKHIERLLGYKLTDTTALPDGAPEDIEQAVLQLAADWFENREANLVGVTAQPIPFGVQEIINEHRNYTFGLNDNG